MPRKPRKRKYFNIYNNFAVTSLGTDKKLAIQNDILFDIQTHEEVGRRFNGQYVLHGLYINPKEKPPSNPAELLQRVQDMEKAASALHGRQMDCRIDDALKTCCKAALGWMLRMLESDLTLPDPPAKSDDIDTDVYNLGTWCIRAMKAKVAVNGKNQKARKKGRRRVSVKEANVHVTEFLKINPKATVRELSEKIGCSNSTIYKTAAWKAVQRELKKGRTPKRKTVRMTEQRLAEASLKRKENERLLDIQHLKEQQDIERRQGN